MERRSNLKPIIIIGAGIIGLTLAQSLKKEGVPFELYERDEALDHRSPGWGITIHWALDALKKCLPEDVFTRIDDVQVDPEQGRQDTGRFLLLDLETLQPRYVIPPSPRRRIHRSKFRALLTAGLDIHWGKTLSSFAPSDDSGDGGIVAKFTDGTEVHGAMLVGADGSNSRARTVLFGNNDNDDDTAAAAALHALPVRFMGVTATLSAAAIAPLRAIDPLLFKGTHPASGVFMWFSVLSTPETNGTALFEAQINLSWILRGPEDEVPAAESDRLARLKEMARGFHPVLRGAVEDIPDGTPVQEIRIADWPTAEWRGDGLVTLLGDAAHAMTMYRGEAANHGFLDAKNLAEQLKLWHDGVKTQRQALEDYEAEMRPRTREAVLLSRQACLDAHDLTNLGPDSPLVSKRARILEPGLKA
ncbi:hypothetical protein F5Y12DRAFT_761973 [Xylaria sp. FL1777]|nr:hypothetical protein F5Y12DRAFT_761973 [Xylaria sp. FL1777]